MLARMEQWVLAVDLPLLLPSGVVIIIQASALLQSRVTVHLGFLGWKWRRPAGFGFFYE
jgi:hypothetical protein